MNFDVHDGARVQHRGALASFPGRPGNEATWCAFIERRSISAESAREDSLVVSQRIKM